MGVYREWGDLTSSTKQLLTIWTTALFKLPGGEDDGAEHACSQVAVVARQYPLDRSFTVAHREIPTSLSLRLALLRRLV